MNVYQLKITDRTAEHAVWQRCLVPGAISFSSLSLILDTLYGVKGGDDAAFIVFRKQTLREPSEAQPLREDSELDASRTILDTLFQSEKTLSYKNGPLYLKLQVESVSEQTPPLWPRLLKSSSPENDEALQQKLSDRFFYVDDDEPLTRRELLSEAEDTRLALSCPLSPAERTRETLKQWVLDCLNEIVPPYYAIMPLKKFCRLCRRTSEPRLDPEEVPAILSDIAAEDSACVVHEGDVVSKELLDDPSLYDYVVGEQNGKPWHIMREDEIDEILENGFPASEYYHKQLLAFLMSELRLPEPNAYGLVSTIHHSAAFGHSIDTVMGVFRDRRIRLREQDVRRLMPLIQGVCNHSPTFYNRGFTPAAMGKALGN